MTPGPFRRLPRLEQIEMMAHRREYHLRKAHSEHVQEIVSEMNRPKDKPTGGRRTSRL